MRCALPLFTAGLLIAASQAFGADVIDLSKPWGNKDGCINKVQEEVASDDVLLLRKDEVVTSTTACTIGKAVANKDGSLTLSASCQAEGEDSPPPFTFSVKRSPKNKAKLVIMDDTGFKWGEVALCR